MSAASAQLLAPPIAATPAAPPRAARRSPPARHRGRSRTARARAASAARPPARDRRRGSGRAAARAPARRLPPSRSKPWALQPEHAARGVARALPSASITRRVDGAAPEQRMRACAEGRVELVQRRQDRAGLHDRVHAEVVTRAVGRASVPPTSASTIPCARAGVRGRQSRHFCCRSRSSPGASAVVRSRNRTEFVPIRARPRSRGRRGTYRRRMPVRHGAARAITGSAVARRVAVVLAIAILALLAAPPGAGAAAAWQRPVPGEVVRAVRLRARPAVRGRIAPRRGPGGTARHEGSRGVRGPRLACGPRRRPGRSGHGRVRRRSR